jgi:hypothetical protein
VAKCPFGEVPGHWVRHWEHASVLWWSLLCSMLKQVLGRKYPRRYFPESSAWPGLVRAGLGFEGFGSREVCRCMRCTAGGGTSKGIGLGTRRLARRAMFLRCISLCVWYLLSMFVLQGVHTCVRARWAPVRVHVCVCVHSRIDNYQCWQVCGVLLTV